MAKVLVMVALKPNKAEVDQVKFEFDDWDKANEQAGRLDKQGTVFYMKATPPRMGIHILKIDKIFVIPRS